MKLMKSRKGQAAMEYLMTYGWAILIVIIVAAALFALGVFNPSSWTPPTPSGFGGIGTPYDWQLQSDGTFILILQNTQSTDTIAVQNVTVELGSILSTWTTYNTSGDNQHFSIGPGAIQNLNEITCMNVNCPDNQYSLNLGTRTVGESYTVKVTLNTAKAAGLITPIVGTLTGVVVAAT